MEEKNISGKKIVDSITYLRLEHITNQKNIRVWQFYKTQDYLHLKCGYYSTLKGLNLKWFKAGYLGNVLLRSHSYVVYIWIIQCNTGVRVFLHLACCTVLYGKGQIPDSIFKNTDYITPKLQLLLVSLKTHQAMIPYSRQLWLLS